jgi:hypothetical protein
MLMPNRVRERQVIALPELEKVKIPLRKREEILETIPIDVEVTED